MDLDQSHAQARRNSDRSFFPECDAPAGGGVETSDSGFAQPRAKKTDSQWHGYSGGPPQSRFPRNSFKGTGRTGHSEVARDGSRARLRVVNNPAQKRTDSNSLSLCSPATPSSKTRPLGNSSVTRKVLVEESRPGISSARKTTSI